MHGVEVELHAWSWVIAVGHRVGLELEQKVEEPVIYGLGAKGAGRPPGAGPGQSWIDTAAGNPGSC